MSAAQHMNVAMMTSGGLAPCLSSSVAYLIEYWASALKEGKISGLNIRMYIDGYKGVLTGDSTVIAPEIYDDCSCLHELGGSPIGNSRVKVSNIITIDTYVQTMTVMMFLAQYSYILCYFLSPQLASSLIHIACLVTIDILFAQKSIHNTQTYKLKYIRDTNNIM